VYLEQVRAKSLESVDDSVQGGLVGYLSADHGVHLEGMTRMSSISMSTQSGTTPATLIA
jgi:hypothetical protein